AKHSVHEISWSSVSAILFSRRRTADGSTWLSLSQATTGRWHILCPGAKHREHVPGVQAASPQVRFELPPRIVQELVQRVPVGSPVPHELVEGHLVEHDSDQHLS